MMPQPSQRALAAYICRATGLLRFGWPVFRHLTHTIASFQLSSLAKEIFTRALKIGLGPLRSLRDCLQPVIPNSTSACPLKNPTAFPERPQMPSIRRNLAVNELSLLALPS